MSNLSENISLKVTDEMKERADEADFNNSKYIRQMWLAGESAVADLDPRVGDSSKVDKEIDTAEAAAQALDDSVLLSELSEEEQEFEDIIQSIAQEFENVLANRLFDLAKDEQSIVESDGSGDYWIER